jgi:DNA-binding MarR family transcriptional regulator
MEIEQAARADKPAQAVRDRSPLRQPACRKLGPRAQDARSVGAVAGRAVMKPRFAPIPARAARDLRLTSRHWRVLAVIALHDQLNKNGAGCWASHDRLAGLLGMDKGHFSNIATDLRRNGYIASTFDPKDRRRRVLRVIYDEQDKTRDRNSYAPEQLNSCVPVQRSEQDSWEKRGRSLVKTGEIVGKNGVENNPKSLQSFPETARTYVNREEHIKKKELIEGTDRAEARLAMRVNEATLEAQQHLATLEALAVSKDRDQLRFERPLIERLANDACLPEALNERAARLLSQIGS